MTENEEIIIDTVPEESTEEAVPTVPDTPEDVPEEPKQEQVTFQKVINTIKDRIKARKNRCRYDEWTWSDERHALVRMRHRKFDIEKLPSHAMPVTGEKRAYASILIPKPERDPSGINAISDCLWMENNSVLDGLTQDFRKGLNIDWKKLLIIIGVTIGVVYFMIQGGMLG